MKILDEFEIQQHELKVDDLAVFNDDFIKFKIYNKIVFLPEGECEEMKLLTAGVFNDHLLKINDFTLLTGLTDIDGLEMFFITLIDETIFMGICVNDKNGNMYFLSALQLKMSSQVDDEENLHIDIFKKYSIYIFKISNNPVS